MKMHRMEKMILMSAAILVIFFVIAVIFKGCGLQPEKRTVVEVHEKEADPQPDVLCDGQHVGSVVDQQCDEGDDGTKILVCRPDGKWYEATNTCKPSCESDVISFDPEIKQIMIDHCVECHGGFSNYEALKGLAESSYGGVSSAQSKLMYYITLPESNVQSMPKDRPALPVDDVNKIQNWIDSGYPETGKCAIDTAYINLDYQLDLALRHVESLDNDDRPFVRFFSLAHKYNLGNDLQGHYRSLNRAINGISFDKDLYNCKPLDSLESICAFDIRAYERTVFDFYLIETFDEVNFVINSTKGQLLRQLTNTDQPIFHFDVFIDTVYSNADLYYSLMNINNFDQMLQEYDIDFNTDVENLDFVSIGTNESDISSGRNTRLITFFEGQIEGEEMTCSITFDNPADDDPATDLFQNPFLEGAGSDKNFKFAASEIICGLPNGLHSYALFDAEGNRQAFAPTDIVFCHPGGNATAECLDSQIDAPIDCFNCHYNGYLPKFDLVGNFIKTSGNFNGTDVAIAREIYPEDTAAAPLFNYYNGIYQSAVQKIDITPNSKNDMIDDYNKFNRRQTLDDVAAFFFVKNQDLIDCINSSNIITEQIGVLLSGNTITHDTFIAVIPDVLKECRFNEDPIR